MTVSFGCQCEERRKPIPERAWRVSQYRCNHSAFNGYRKTPSDYSTVVCLRCLTHGRTKAQYVEQLKLIQPGEWEQAVSPEFMEPSELDEAAQAARAARGGEA